MKEELIMQTFTSNCNFSYTETNPLPYDNYEKDVVTVLESVKTLFENYFFNVNLTPLHIVGVHPSSNAPQTIYEHYKIELSVSPFDAYGNPGGYWSQFAYQFSHEFCHYMNWGHVTQKMRWFEESICELASHFFLIKLAESWALSPPYETWRNYAPQLLSYQINSRIPNTTFNLKSLTNSDNAILNELEKDEYKRQFNRFVALELLPLFISNTDLWKIVPYLTQLPGSNSFRDNLILLGNLSNQDISEILCLFGI